MISSLNLDPHFAKWLPPQHVSQAITTQRHLYNHEICDTEVEDNSKVFQCIMMQTNNLSGASKQVYAYL